MGAGQVKFLMSNASRFEERAMGMFDHVRCEVPLPDGFTGAMQTKDFDCVLGTLLIRADGRLMIQECDWEEVPLEERPNPVIPFLGSRRAINKRWHDLDFHGDFRFHGSEGVGGKWHEYAARFTHGTLESIDVVPKDSYPQSDASARARKAQHSTAATAKDDLTPGRRLDEILATLPEDRRLEVENQVAELIADAARELDDFRT